MSSRIRVMSYNVRYDNPSDDTYVWRKRRDEVAGVVRFHDPALVGLQEALHNQLRDLRDRLSDDYDWLRAGRRDTPQDIVGEYAAIGYDATRFDLEDQWTLWLSESGEPGAIGWDAMLPRLVRIAKLRENDTGVAFYFCNTHFDHAGERARIESAELLRSRIDELPTDAPVVVTGDFNARAVDPAYERLVGDDGRRRLFDAHFADDVDHHGPETSVTDFTSLVPDRKIDHVFVTSDVEVLLHGTCSDTYDDGLYPSDHLPVIADVSLPHRRSVN